MNANHTAGPWYWHIDSNGLPSLRTPDRGNLIVMDFARKGMRAATMRFAHWPGIYSGVPRQRLGGILHDFSGEGVNHPDARLIEAAPAMALCLDLMKHGLARIVVTGTLVEFAFGGLRYCYSGDWSKLLDVIGWQEARDAIANALAKVTGSAA